MKFSEFVLTDIKGSNPLDLEYFADVTVTTESGMLWWKKKNVERKKITRKYACMWMFLDTGEYTPGFEVEKLERAFLAKVSLAEIRAKDKK